MVCLMQQEFFFLTQQDLRQLELVCLKWQELFNLKQQKLEQLLLCLKQKEVIFLESLSLKQVELLFLKQLELFSLEKMDLICLKQQEFLCMELLNLKLLSLKQQEMDCLKHQELICLQILRLIQPEIMYFKQLELVCLNLKRQELEQSELLCLELVCLKQLELLNLEQTELEQLLLCLKQQEVICLESFSLKQLELLDLKQLVLLSLKQPEMEQQKLVCLQMLRLTQPEMVSLKQLDLVLKQHELGQLELLGLKKQELLCFKQQKLVFLELLTSKQLELVCLKQIICLKLLKFKQLELKLQESHCLELFSFRHPELACLKQHELVWLELKQPELACLKLQELACFELLSLIYQPEMVWLKLQESVFLDFLDSNQQELELVQQKSVYLILLKFLNFKLHEFIFVVQLQLLSHKWQELVCIGLLSLNQPELLSMKQQELKQLKFLDLKQQGLVFLEQTILTQLKLLNITRQELVCLNQLQMLTLKQLGSICLNQQELLYLIQLELLNLKWHEPVYLIQQILLRFKQLELLYLEWLGLISLRKQELDCLVQKELEEQGLVSWLHKKLVGQIMLCLMHQESVSMKLPACTTSNCVQQQKFCLNLPYFDKIHIAKYFAKEVEFLFIQHSNTHISINSGCPAQELGSMLRSKVENRWICCLVLIVLLFDAVLIGLIINSKEKQCNPTDKIISDPSFLPHFQFSLESEMQNKAYFSHRNAQCVLFKTPFVKYKARFQNMYPALQQVFRLGFRLYVNMPMPKNVRFVKPLLCTFACLLANADKVVLKADVAEGDTVWGDNSIGSTWKFKTFQLHMCFGHVQFNKQLLEARSCIMSRASMNAKDVSKDVVSMIDAAVDESSCSLVISSAKNALCFWDSYHQLVIATNSSLNLTMKCDTPFRPVGKGSDPHSNHSNKHNQQKHFTSIEADGSTFGVQAATVTEYHRKNQTGVNDDRLSSSDLDHDVESDGHRKYNSQFHKDNQPLITAEGFTKDQNKGCTNIVPNCNVKYKPDRTIIQDVVKDGKGAVDISQSAISINKALNSVITHNVIKDGRGAVETRSSALLQSKTSVDTSLSSREFVAQKPLQKHAVTDSGPQLIKTLPKETDQLPPEGLQYNVLYDTNTKDEVPMARDEKSGTRKIDKTVHKYHQKDLPSNAQPKNSAVKNETSKSGAQKTTFPKRSCIAIGNKTFTLDPNLLAHPHMDTYFVKERTQTRPGHFLARLVLHHAYLDK